MIPWPELRQTSPTRRAQTIVQAASLFNQLLQHFPRTEFASLVKKHGAERAAKGFTYVLGRSSSPCCFANWAAPIRYARHLQRPGLLFRPSGACRYCCWAPSRSTLSYANEHRPAALFEELFWTALARFREQQGLGSRKHKVPASRTNCCRWIRPPSQGYASRCFRGRSSAAPRAA